VSAFFDTNILIYAVAGDPRRQTAQKLIADGGFISVQVLNEFVAVTRRKMNLDWTAIESALGAFLRLFHPPVPLTADLSARARELARLHGLPVYDALVIAAGQSAGCSVLYSEDMQHARRFGALQVINPFLEPQG
jgi:predicted nucleic acid-binding protein